MKPEDVQVIGKELAIRWKDGSESFVPLDTLRQSCPCAGCKGEGDIMGNISRGPQQVLTEASFQLRRITWVGGYGLQPHWADGHNSGIFSFDTLRELGGSLK